MQGCFGWKGFRKNPTVAISIVFLVQLAVIHYSQHSLPQSNALLNPNFVSVEIQTWGRWVRSTNTSSVLCHPRPFLWMTNGDSVTNWHFQCSDCLNIFSCYSIQANLEDVAQQKEEQQKHARWRKEVTEGKSRLINLNLKLV